MLPLQKSCHAMLPPYLVGFPYLKESWIEELRGAPIIVEIRISVTRFGHVPTAVSKPSRKSTMAYGLFVNNAVFSWKSCLSSIVATSTCEAELMAYCS